MTAVVAARAALDRLGWSAPDGVVAETLDAGTMIPQVAQGALAVECRVDDEATGAALAAVDDPAVRRVVEAERAFLAELGGGCTLPVGAYAVASPDGSGTLVMTGMVAGADGHVVLRHEAAGSDGPALGRAVARYLLDDAGGADLGPWRPSA